MERKAKFAAYFEKLKLPLLVLILGVFLMLLPVFVLAVAPVFGQHDVVQFGVVDLPVDDGDLAGHAVFQGVEDLAVFEELVLLVLPAGNGIVDVSELKCL